MLAPIPNLLISSMLSGQSVISYISNFDSLFRAIAFFTFFPIAGFAIYKVRRWSYPVFVIVMLWSFWVNYQSFANFPGSFPVFLLAVIYLVNFALVAYFLIPAVREVYFNERLRWWESKPRYDLEAPLEVVFEGQKRTGKLKNLSVGGVFLELDEAIEVNSDGRLLFTVRDYPFELEGKFLYKNPKIQAGYGVQFQNLTRHQKKQLKQLTQELDRAGVKRRPERLNLWENFTAWVKGVFTSGKGVVPEIPDHLRRK